MRSLPPSARVGVAITLAILAAALVGPAVTPYGETQTAGAVWAWFSPAHWLGTDNLGRDLLTRPP